MRKLMTAGLAGATLVAGVAASTAASAQVHIGSPGFEQVQYRGYGYGHGGYNRGYYNRGYGHHYNRGHYRRNNNDAAAAAIIGGVLGYALGAATAPRQQYYSQPYYGRQTYYAPPVYYAPQPRYYAPPVYYSQPYYGGHHGGYYGRSCGYYC
jgi:hypothetical protein